MEAITTPGRNLNASTIKPWLESNWQLRAEAAITITAALDEIERLRKPPEEYCAKCGSPKSDHPYRHIFVPCQALKGADQ